MNIARGPDRKRSILGAINSASPTLIAMGAAASGRIGSQLQSAHSLRTASAFMIWLVMLCSGLRTAYIPTTTVRPRTDPHGRPAIALAEGSAATLTVTIPGSAAQQVAEAMSPMS
jgi:hypothetical protein